MQNYMQFPQVAISQRGWWLVVAIGYGISTWTNAQSQELQSVSGVQPVAATAHVSSTGSMPNALYLSMGKQHTLVPAWTPGRVAVGNPAVLDVQVLRNRRTGDGSQAQLLLTPKGTGSTSLVLWPQQGGGSEQWEVQVSGPQLVLERRLKSLPEHAALMQSFQAGLAPNTTVLDRSRIDVLSNTVQVDVQVVEFKKSAMKKVGLNLESGINDKGFRFSFLNPSSSGGAPFADAMNLVLNFGKAFSGQGITANLSLLEGNGLAKVLARPTLVAHSGQSASFLAGGQLPIPVSASDGNIAIEYKEFGVRLQLTPTVLSNERIALKVAPETSDLDYSSPVVAAGGAEIPIVRTRRADTMVELADGESFVIGGLVSRNTASNVRKVPLLGDLPILGSFFKSMSYSQDESELVIVVTPHLVHPLPAGTPIEAYLPGAYVEQPNATGVWDNHFAGGSQSIKPMPGFSY